MTDRPNAEDYRNRCERAEAECKELRDQIEMLEFAAAFYREHAIEGS